jgi:Ser/Thr protein kinase RdoA (MazF antagonist)
LTIFRNSRRNLKQFKSTGLNVPICLEENRSWFLYEKLKGDTPKNIKIYHIQELARFLAKLHKHTYKKGCKGDFIQNYEIKKLLNYTKANFFAHYKKLQTLKSYKPKNDGFIHGDLFKDNTVFHNKKIGVFDFIDSGTGGFGFECGVCMVGFGVKSNFYINLFLNSYNQKAPKKLTKKELLYEMKVASRFYALLRINNHKNIYVIIR